MICKNCYRCGNQFQPETGFYFGAMYFSYALVSGVSIGGGFILLNAGWDINVVSMLIPFSILLLLPLAVRSSRLLMLYWIKPMMYKEIVRKERESWAEQNNIK
ncbi:MAG: DUF983 domain-containing protein [Bacteroidetes bacterium]|nr:DUF983 domain-containing protein [Bacteroidota bacterium]